MSSSHDSLQTRGLIGAAPSAIIVTARPFLRTEEEEKGMKLAILVSAVLGISATSALADCNYHNVTASAPTDRQQTTASTDAPTQADEAVVVASEISTEEKAAAE
jgi:hypothetical protein